MSTDPTSIEGQSSKKSILKVSRSKWVRFSIWTVVTLLFVLWTGSFWWLTALPLFFDLYISRKLPWNFWKGFKNKTLRTIFDWIDAIVFALIAVYIINIYFFQNYQIPSSSLEKSLLVGDFLFVSKVSYGPRVPMTPVSFPLAQHTMPILGTKSYFDKPQWGYKRIPGFGHIKRNDIVVFNFPAGDSVVTKITNPDFYTTCYMLAMQNDVSEEDARRFVLSHPEEFGKLVYRPVDKRENYVKRCVGLPGDTLQVVNNRVFINRKLLKDAPNVQYTYFVQTKGEYLSERQFKKWNILLSDIELIPENSYKIQLQHFKKNASGGYNPVYEMPLTQSLLKELRKCSFIDTIFISKDMLGGMNEGGTMYPLNINNHWTRDNYGPIWIPKKGATITLNAHNLMVYSHVIVHYEKRKLDIKNGNAYIDGKLAKTFTFSMDYYWMMGDNRHKSADSRAWGFVPEDHIVGKPIIVWLSLDKDKTLFEGKIRWKRFFKKAI